MPLNAVRFAAKRKLKCSKMRDEKHKHTQQLYNQNLLKPCDTWLKWAKRPLKSGVLGAKSG